MIDRVLQSIYAPSELAATAYAIANDGRQWLGCDRLTVLEHRRGRCRVLAISGVDLVDRRSASVATLEDLATFVANNGEDLLYPDGRESFEPDLVLIVEDHLNEAHSRMLLACPLSGPVDLDTPPEFVGVVILEQFAKDVSMGTWQEKLSQARAHFGIALGHATARQRAPLSRLSATISRWQSFLVRQRMGWLSVAGLLLAGLATALFLPVELRVSAQGELQPVIRRDVFANDDGIVERLMVQHGDTVRAGELLIEMTQTELEYARSQLDGQLRTAQQELQAIVARRWGTAQEPISSDEGDRLAAEQAGLVQVIDGLKRQRKILEKRQNQLRLESPVDGNIVTWETQQRLLNRPVRRGQRLLSVVDPSGPWIAELRIADGDIRHVIQARQRSELRPDVTFRLATDPGTTYHGSVQEIAQITDGDDKPSVRVRVRVDGDQIPLKRPGATVVARIQCGRRSFIYGSLRHVWDWLTVHSWW